MADREAASYGPGRQGELSRSTWRRGRGGGARIVYAQLGPEPDPGDPRIGSMANAALARDVIDDHNAALDERERADAEAADRLADIADKLGGMFVG